MQSSDDLYSSGIFASELEDDFGDDKELDPDAFEPDDDDMGDDDDDDDGDEDEASYNPLDDYKPGEWE
jgi:hypothetical protein